MGDNIQVVTESYVTVIITTVSNIRSERRFIKSLTVADLKGKLELITGVSWCDMDIQVYDNTDKLVCTIDDDNKLLGSYPVDSGMRLHVLNRSKKGSGSSYHDEFQDLSKVDKYVMSKEDYAKRSNTVQSFLRKNKVGKYNEEEMKRLAEEKELILKREIELSSKMKLGDRCEVTIPGSGKRRGTIRFIGETHFQPSIWVGVQYDEPLGRNDGSFDGKRYFDCPNKYGGFVKPSHVSVGDYPEEEIDCSDDEM